MLLYSVYHSRLAQFSNRVVVLHNSTHYVVMESIKVVFSGFS